MRGVLNNQIGKLNPAGEVGFVRYPLKIINVWKQTEPYPDAFVQVSDTNNYVLVTMQAYSRLILTQS